MQVNFNDLISRAAPYQSQQSKKKKKQQRNEENKIAFITPVIVVKAEEEKKTPSKVESKVSDISEVVYDKVAKSEDAPVTEPQPLVVSTQSKSVEREEVPSEIVSEEKPIDLDALLKDLSAEAQDKFEESLEEQQEEVAKFQSIFSKNNKTYIAKKEQMKTPSIQEHFYQLRETEKQQYQELKISYSKLAEIFTARIKALSDAIANHLFESSLLDQTVIGNDSYAKSFSIWNLSMGYRYGATFRLWELTEKMEERRKFLGIKKDEKPSEEGSEIAVIPSSEACQKLANISRDIDILKEEVTICNEALKKEAKAVADTELPRQYHIYHRQRLDAIKESLAQLTESLEKQVVQLKKDLELESSTPESPKAFACQRELLEIEMRRVAILHRQGEIEQFLNQRKKEFKLVELGLDTKEPVKLADLSPEYNKALSLIGRITALKEDIVLSNNNWEKFGSLEQRKVTYFQNAKQLELLLAEKSGIESKELPERKKMIDTAVLTYTGYIVNIQQTMHAIDSHFKLLEKDSLERASWQIALPKKQVEAPKVDASSGEGKKGIESSDQKESVEVKE